MRRAIIYIIERTILNYIFPVDHVICFICYLSKWINIKFPEYKKRNNPLWERINKIEKQWEVIGGMLIFFPSMSGANMHKISLHEQHYLQYLSDHGSQWRGKFVSIPVITHLRDYGRLYSMFCMFTFLYFDNNPPLLLWEPGDGGDRCHYLGSWIAGPAR